MQGKILMIMIAICACFVLSNTAWAREGISFSVISMDEFDINEYPVIYGNVTDSKSNPLSNVEIQANFPSRVIMTSTNSTGEFSITYPVFEDMGEYTVVVYAINDSLHLTTEITYKVVDMQQRELERRNISLEKNPTREKNFDNSEYDLFSRLNTIEQFKQQIEHGNDTVSDEQKQIEESRFINQYELERDLISFEQQNDFHSPRNAFLRFLDDIDNSIKRIFWDQFLFTEKKTQDGHAAKEKAILDGMSPQDAMKVFQESAASTHSEITNFTKNLNIKYANATHTVQEQFDENGKIPRDD